LDAPTANSPTAIAAGIVRRIRILVRANAAAEANATPQALSPRSEAPPAGLIKHFADYSWGVYLQRQQTMLFALLAITTGGVWIAAWKIERKPPVVARAPASLRELADDYFGLSEVSYDSATFFLVSVLPTLHGLDDSGAPMLALVQGQVAPKIFAAANARIARDLPRARSNLMTQQLVLSSVGEIVTDTVTQRIGAYVRGYLVVTTRRLDTPAVYIPYRAQVLLSLNPPGKLNPSPYYLFSLEEKIGDAAIDWDKTMTRKPGNAP